MLDRGSIFEDEALVGLLKQHFVNVAVDVNEIQGREGPSGDFYRKVVTQRNGMLLERSTQGHYICDVDGTLLRGSNNRDVDMLSRHVERVLSQHDGRPRALPEAELGAGDGPTPPEGTSFVEVFSLVLEADWPEPADGEEAYRQTARGRDFLWITASERAALTAEAPTFPDSLAQRIARFHVVDNTRCEGLRWNRGDVSALELRLEAGGSLTGRAAAETEDERRRYSAAFGGASRTAGTNT